MQIKIKDGKVITSRDNYKAFKKYDRQQVDDLLQAMYDKGIEDGKPEIPEHVRVRQGISIAADAVVHALEETKGIGEKRREEIQQRFRKHSEEGFQKLDLEK